jgi:hypothetical protein
VLRPEARPITVESRVDETIARYPSTGPIFLQGRPLPVAAPAAYPGLTLGEYTRGDSVALARLLELLNAAAEGDQFAHHTAGPPRPQGAASGWRARTTPPVGSIGYTATYREPFAEVVEVSMVSVLEARGPD